MGARGARSDAQDATNLEQVGLEGIDEAGGLSVFAGGANGDAVVFDDVADAEAVAADGAEAELPQGRVAAVGGADDGVVEAVPARVGKDEREGCGGARVGAVAARAGDHVVRVRVRAAAAAAAAAFALCLLVAVDGEDGVARGTVYCGPGAALVGARARVPAAAAAAAAAPAIGADADGGFVEQALPKAKKRVEVPVAPLALGAVLGVVDVRGTRTFEGLDLLLGRVVGPKGLHKVEGLVRDGTHGLGAAVEVHFGHGRLVGALDAAVEAVVGGLEGHLHKGVRGEAHGGDEVLAVRLEVEALEFILLNEVGEPGLGKAHRDPELGRHVPLELVRGGIHVAKRVRVALGWVRGGGGPESRRQPVDGAREAQDRVGVDIAREAEDGVPVDAGMLKVDTRAAIVAHDNLELVVPPVGAGADLYTLFNLARTAEHVLAQRGRRDGFGVVEADDEEGRVDDAEAVGVVGPFFSGQNIPKAGPDFSVFCAEHAECSLGCVLNGCLGSIVDDGLQVDGDVLLRHDQVRVVIQDIEPVKLSMTHDHEVLGLRILLNLATSFCRYPCCAKES